MRNLYSYLMEQTGHNLPKAIRLAGEAYERFKKHLSREEPAGPFEFAYDCCGYEAFTWKPDDIVTVLPREGWNGPEKLGIVSGYAIGCGSGYEVTVRTADGDDRRPAHLLRPTGYPPELVEIMGRKLGLEAK